jgi:hypothetical protein
MKFLKSLLSIHLFVCLFVVNTHASNVKHKVVFNTSIIIDTTIAADGNIYSRINLSDCSFSSEEGMPQLPVKIVKLIIPSGEEPTDVICTKGKGEIPLAVADFQAVPIYNSLLHNINICLKYA